MFYVCYNEMDEDEKFQLHARILAVRTRTSGRHTLTGTHTHLPYTYTLHTHTYATLLPSI